MEYLEGYINGAFSMSSNPKETCKKIINTLDLVTYYQQQDPKEEFSSSKKDLIVSMASLSNYRLRTQEVKDEVKKFAENHPEHKEFFDEILDEKEPLEDIYVLELQAQLENSINDLLNLGRKPEEIFKAVINIVDMTASNELTKENLQEKMDILWSQDYNLQSEETKTFVKDLKENPNIPWSWKAFL